MIESLHELFKLLVGLNLGQVTEHDDVLELVVVVEVVAHLLHKTSLADMLTSSDMHKRDRV